MQTITTAAAQDLHDRVASLEQDDSANSQGKGKD